MNQQHYVSGPADLVAAIPHILGFHPDESLVLVVLNDDYVETIHRCDLSTADGWPQAELRYCSGTDLVALLYSNDGIGSFQTLLDDYLSHYETANFNVLDKLLVISNRWKSLLCDDLDCCPAAGREVVSAALRARDFETSGSNINHDVPFVNRDVLIHSLRAALIPHEDELTRDAELIKVLDRIKSGTVLAEDADELKARQFRLSVVEEIVSALRTSDELAWNARALIVGGLHDIHIRDCVLKRMLDDDSLRQSSRRHLLQMIPTMNESSVVVLATALAGCVWLDGNGALARIALERALECDPSYSLAILLNRAISFGVPPTVWSDSLIAVSEEECLLGAA